MEIGSGAVGYFINVSIADNEAEDSAGGIMGCGGELNLTNVTVAGNFANTANGFLADGGGIWYCASVSPLIHLRSSIVADNIAINGDYPDCVGEFASAAASLVGNPGPFSRSRCRARGSNSGNLFDLPADLGASQFWGYALLASSPAIDAGLCESAIGPPLDLGQRGNVMPADGDDDQVADCDMGAWEFNSGPPPPGALIFDNGFE